MPWLIKSEPESFSIQDLAKAPKKTTFWNGVRNYQARNFLRDAMKKGDLALYYHSGGPAPAVVGIAMVVKEGYADHTQFEANSDYYDAAATKDDPRWFMVDVKLVRIFDEPMTLESLRKVPALGKMVLLQRGSRLSVQPVTQAEFDAIVKLRPE